MTAFLLIWASNIRAENKPATPASSKTSEEFVIQDIQPTLPFPGLTGKHNDATIVVKGEGENTTIAVRRVGEPQSLVVVCGAFAWANALTDKEGWVRVGRTTMRVDKNGGALPGANVLVVGPDTEVSLSHGKNALSGKWFEGSVDLEASRYALIGSVPILGYTFNSEKGHPLIFTLVKGKGFVYQSGKGSITDKDGKTIKSFENTGALGSAEDRDATVSSIPSKFLGEWVYKEEDKVTGQLTVTAKTIEWKHVVLDQEDKTVAKEFTVTSDGEKVTFEAKITYSRDVFWPRGAHKGDAKVTLQVKDGMMSVEIGGTKTEEAGGVVITTPPKKYLYVRSVNPSSSPWQMTKDDVPSTQNAPVEVDLLRVSDRHCMSVCLRLAEVGISNDEIQGKMTPVAPDVNAYEMTYPAKFQGTVTDPAKVAMLGLKNTKQGDKVDIQILSATESSVRITHVKTGASAVAQLGTE